MNFLNVKSVAQLSLLSVSLLASCGKSASSNRGVNQGLTNPSSTGSGSGVDPYNPTGISVSTNFNPIVGSYDGINESSSLKTCVSKGYIGWSGYDPNTMIIDGYNPVFEENVAVRIVPDADRRPVSYEFSGKISDDGCGAPKLKAVCVFWNVTANAELANGATLAQVGIPQPFIYAPAQDCMVNNAASTNSYAEFMYHVISSARFNDKLELDIYLQDGSGNYSPSQTLTFYKYEQLMAPTTVSAH